MLNRITLMGRLTRDPEERLTSSGVHVTNFSIAVDRDFKSDNGEKETDFIDCVAWRHTAEFVSKYFEKGQMAVVSGRLQIRQWTDKEGNNRRTAEVVADNVYFGESKRDKQANQTYNPPHYDPPAPSPEYFYNANASGVPAAAPKFPQQAPGQFEIVDDDDSELPF